MPTIGQDSTLTCVMTQLLRTTFNLSQLSNRNQRLHMTCQSCQGTCHTTEVCESRLIHPPLLLTMKNTKDCWRTQSFILILKYLPIHPTAQFNLKTLATFSLPILVIVFNMTMSSQHMHFPYHNSTGQSILSTLAILLHWSALVTSQSMWHQLATHLHMDECLWRNLLHADVYFLAQWHCWITFRDLTINQPSNATWFTPIDSNPANLPVHLRHCKLPLLLNCTPYDPYQCLLHLFTRTKTAAVFCVLSTTSPKLDGLQQWCAWTSPTMAIQLLDPLPLLLTSTMLLNHQSKIPVQNSNQQIAIMF